MLNEKILERLICSVFKSQNLADLSCLIKYNLTYDKLKEIVKYLPFSISVLDLSGNKLFTSIAYQKLYELLSLIPSHVKIVDISDNHIELGNMRQSSKEKIFKLMNEKNMKLIY